MIYAEYLYHYIYWADTAGKVAESLPCRPELLNTDEIVWSKKITVMGY